MRKIVLATVAAALALAGGAAAYALATRSAPGADGSAAFRCPLTGEVISADQCPLCPGADARGAEGCVEGQ